MVPDNDDVMFFFFAKKNKYTPNVKRERPYPNQDSTKDFFLQGRC